MQSEITVWPIVIRKKLHCGTCLELYAYKNVVFSLTLIFKCEST